MMTFEEYYNGFIKDLSYYIGESKAKLYALRNKKILKKEYESDIKVAKMFKGREVNTSGISMTAWMLYPDDLV